MRSSNEAQISSFLTHCQWGLVFWVFFWSVTSETLCCFTPGTLTAHFSPADIAVSRFMSFLTWSYQVPPFTLPFYPWLQMRFRKAKTSLRLRSLLLNSVTPCILWCLMRVLSQKAEYLCKILRKRTIEDKYREVKVVIRLDFIWIPVQWGYFGLSSSFCAPYWPHGSATSSWSWGWHIRCMALTYMEEEQTVPNGSKGHWEWYHFFLFYI